MDIALAEIIETFCTSCKKITPSRITNSDDIIPPVAIMDKSYVYDNTTICEECGNKSHHSLPEN